MEKCLPILIPLRKDDMKAVQMAQAELAKQMEPEQGTVVTVDKVSSLQNRSTHLLLE